MLRPPHTPPDQRSADGDRCPPPIDLASLAEGRLSDAESERIEAHVARCATCLELLRGLRAEASAVAEEARLVFVPPSVMQAAMDLRAGDEAGVTSVVVVRSTRVQPLWMSMQRGLAAAAALGIAATGYVIGQSMTPAHSSAVSPSGATDDLAFGLLDSTSAQDSGDLFALAFPASSTTNAEATP